MVTFDESQWATPGSKIDYHANSEVESEILSIRELYAELADWGDLAIFSAWGSYSQDNHQLPWSPVMQREQQFLDYLIYIQSGQDIMQWSGSAAS